jgi:hypothetical protein
MLNKGKKRKEKRILVLQIGSSKHINRIDNKNFWIYRRVIILLVPCSIFFYFFFIFFISGEGG